MIYTSQDMGDTLASLKVDINLMGTTGCLARGTRCLLIIDTPFLAFSTTWRVGVSVWLAQFMSTASICQNNCRWWCGLLQHENGHVVTSIAWQEAHHNAVDGSQEQDGYNLGLTWSTEAEATCGHWLHCQDEVDGHEWAAGSVIHDLFTRLLMSFTLLNWRLSIPS